MINEEELFIKLLDNDAADKVLRMLNENVKSKSIGLKRIKLKKIFRTGSTSTMKKKLNPFDLVIQKCSNPKFKKFNEIELFKFFSQDVEEKIPNYIKFANAIYYYRDKTIQNLEQLINNYENDESLFKNVIRFKSTEEVEKFFLANNMCSNEIKNNAIEHILEKIDKDEKLILNNINEFIEKWTLIDYENKFDKYSKEYPIYLIQLQYLVKHKNKVQIENGIALDMIFNYYNMRKENLEEYNNEIEEVQNLSEDIKKKYEQSIIENNQLKNKVREFSNKVEKLSNNLDNALINNKNDNLKYEKIKDKNLFLKSRNEELEKKLEEIDNYFKYQDLENKYQELNYEFTVINSSSMKLVKKIFPEVLFINIDDSNLDILKNTPKYTQNIYIQRSGILSSTINYIERWAEKNNINTKIIMPINEKEMIQEIVKIKLYNQGVKYDAN